MYEFLKKLEADERNKSTISWWDEEFTKVFPFTPTESYIQRTIHAWNGIALPNVLWRLRGFDALEQWWAKFGLGECPTSSYAPTWDEHKYKVAYEEMQFHAPFDTLSFVTAIDAMTGRDLVKFRGAIIPEWVLSPSYNYVDEPTKLYRAMRDVWYGERAVRERFEFGDCAIRYAWHQHHYFLYQPEPELWNWLAHHAKPSYAKCRLYALNVKKDMSVLEERFLHSLVNLQVTKPNGKKELWKAGQQS